MIAFPSALPFPTEPTPQDVATDNSGALPEDDDDGDLLDEFLAADPTLLPLLDSPDLTVACAAWTRLANAMATADARCRCEAAPDAPTQIGPGRWDKVRLMQERLANRQPLAITRDGDDADLDDHLGFEPVQHGNQVTRGDLLVVDAVGITRVPESRPPRRGGHRRRTVAEKIKAARQTAKEREAARKREVRARAQRAS